MHVLFKCVSTGCHGNYPLPCPLPRVLGARVPGAHGADMMLVVHGLRGLVTFKGPRRRAAEPRHGGPPGRRLWVLRPVLLLAASVAAAFLCGGEWAGSRLGFHN